MIPIAKPLMGEEEIAAVTEVMRSGRLAQGPKVEEFEKNFSEYCGTKHAVATSSGTTALHLALLAAGIEPGDEVITTPFTFIATANSIRFCGAKPVFADINPDTFNLDPETLDSALTENTVAIMPVHLYGQCCDMEGINDFAGRHGLKVIEDACQAHGAEYRGKKAGALGLAGCFSFYPTKNMATGEGGMITTDDGEIADKARLLRSHGERKRYDAETLGFNFRMTDMAAAIGTCQLKKLERWNERRRRNAAVLDEMLEGKAVTPAVAEGCLHCYHQYTIRVKDGERDGVAAKLAAKGVGTGIYYPMPVYRQRALALDLNMENAEQAAKEVLSLPVHPGLRDGEVEFVAKRALEALEGM